MRVTKLPVMSPASFSGAVAVFVVALLNGTFWTQIYALVSPRSATDWLFLASFFVFQVAVYMLVLRAFAIPVAMKAIAAAGVLIAAIASYFMREYGTVIDMNMVRNVFQTDPAETRDLVTLSAIVWIVGLGVVPAALILFAPVRWPAWKPLLRSNAIACLGAVAVVGANFGAFSGAYFSVLRENVDIAFTATPANVFIAGGKLAVHSMRHYSGPIAPIGLDARVEPAAAPGARPLVTVVVVGETARAANFSLLGYARETNPELAKVPDLVAFPRVSSCGTDTGVSVPCIFSGLGRSRYSLSAVQRRENLLDVVRRTGLDVVWIENQGGCKGVCARTPTVTLTNSTDPRFCATGECHDEILLDGLEERIAGMRNGGVIVLHMMGSHGPAYYKRVPAAFARFQPTCEISQFSKCESEQIVNSYDNTILYTDHVLAGVVDILRRSAQGGADAMMLYFSDHGESLGENGVYLHAMPYVLAPEHQKHVPMFMWMSAGAREAQHVQQGCVADAARTGQFSHDNVFHTVLGLHRIRTSLYEPALDILQPCRTGPQGHAMRM